jgi:hypothetical protein
MPSSSASVLHPLTQLPASTQRQAAVCTIAVCCNARNSTATHTTRVDSHYCLHLHTLLPAHTNTTTCMYSHNCLHPITQVPTSTQRQAAVFAIALYAAMPETQLRLITLLPACTHTTTCIYLHSHLHLFTVQAASPDICGLLSQPFLYLHPLNSHSN